MGILNSLQAEIEKLNPANIIHEVEASRIKLEEFEARMGDLEKSLTTIVAVARKAAPVIELAYPQATPEVTAILLALESITAATPSTAKQ